MAFYLIALLLQICYANTSVLFKEMEHRMQVDSTYIDFPKAFDTVPHMYAVEKFKHVGFPDWFTEWLMSYLSDGKAFVKVNSACSNSFDIPSGVPQGSVLGPLIFVLYINDLCPRISSGKLLFADDMKMFRVIATVVDCLALQADINELLCWCHENGMNVDINKCKVITFSRKRSSIIHQYQMGSIQLDVRTCAVNS